MAAMAAVSCWARTCCIGAWIQGMVRGGRVAEMVVVSWLHQLWQLGHQWVLRPESRSRRIVVPHTRQDWPPRRYTQAWPP